MDFSTRERIHLTKIQVFLLTLYRAQRTCVPAAVGCVHSVNRITKLLKIKTEIGPLIVSAYRGPILYEIQGRKLIWDPGKKNGNYAVPRATKCCSCPRTHWNNPLKRTPWWFHSYHHKKTQLDPAEDGPALKSHDQGEALDMDLRTGQITSSWRQSRESCDNFQEASCSLQKVVIRGGCWVSCLFSV